MDALDSTGGSSGDFVSLLVYLFSPLVSPLWAWEEVPHYNVMLYIIIIM